MSYDAEMARKRMAQVIRDCGQDIADHSDDLLGNHPFPRGITITIDIGPDLIPHCKVERGFIPETYIAKMENK